MIFERVRQTVAGAVDGWRGFREPETLSARALDYAFLWSFYDGSAFTPAWRRQGIFDRQRIYLNTRQLYSHVTALGDFYGNHVYQGPLTTDGQTLPDGTRGAIPLDPQTGDTAQDAAILKATGELWNRQRWQQFMGLRPQFGSILGDVLVELLPDPEHHAVWPQHVWPGYVVEIELNQVGDVKRYIVEYPTLAEVNGREKTIRFRREVDDKQYKYFADDDPWDAYGDGAVVDHPYGFCPAIWDRHKIGWDERGITAFSEVVQQLLEVNSFASHAIDYQRKSFAAPVVVKGSRKRSTSSNPATAGRPLLGPPRVTEPGAIAEAFTVKEVEIGGGIEQITSDIGQTVALLEWVKGNILEANPEPRFYHELRQMSQLTAPGVTRAIGDVMVRLDGARKNYDPQTVKLVQMQLAMMGHALNSGMWEDVQDRDRIFKPFDLDTYAKGGLDMSILPRGMVPTTEDERIDTVLKLEGVRYADSFQRLGRSETEAGALILARERADLRRADGDLIE